jgi:hypothetical protein
VAVGHLNAITATELVDAGEPGVALEILSFGAQGAGLVYGATTSVRQREVSGFGGERASPHRRRPPSAAVLIPKRDLLHADLG